MIEMVPFFPKVQTIAFSRQELVWSTISPSVITGSIV